MSESKGVNKSERYLARLCSRPFLRLWTHSNLYRDQGRRNGKGDGKELADVLAVCGSDVIILSDKACEFSSRRPLSIAWDRWFHESIEKSADQAYGAERWLKLFPAAVYRDRSCTVPFDFPLPPPESAKYHRIVVTSGLQTVGQVLRLSPAVLGPKHYAREGGIPFVVGQIDPAKGFVHVWDEESAGRLTRELDTLADLIRYLNWKEGLASSGRLLTAASESDLLGYYMYHRENRSDRRFLEPPSGTAITVNAGQWKYWADNPLRSARAEANRISYDCDLLINHLAERAIEGATLDPIDKPHSHAEQLFRRLALEPRLVRRALATAWWEAARDPRFAEGGHRVLRGFGAESVYVLQVTPRPANVSEEQYRDYRYKLLDLYMLAAMSAHSPPVHMIGIAIEPNNFRIDSVDVAYFDPAKWTSEAQAAGEHAREELGVLKRVDSHVRITQEIPGGPLDRQVREAFARRPSLNAKCPCGKGKAFKNCCGRKLKNRGDTTPKGRR